MKKNRRPGNAFKPAAGKSARAPGYVVDKRDSDGMTKLMTAAQLNLIAEMQACLDEGADIDAVDNNGQTPMMHAALNGRSTAVVFLANKGADVAAVNKQNVSALMMSCMQRRDMTEAIETLVKKGAPLDVRGNLTHTTALIHTIHNHDIWAACRLIRAGADFDTIGDTRGRTAESLGLEAFSGKDLKFFTDAIAERRETAEQKRQKDIDSAVTGATVLQRDLKGMKPLVLRKQGLKPRQVPGQKPTPPGTP